MAATVTYAPIDGGLVYENRGGVETYYVPDTQGSLIECHDATGAITYEAWYWPYGEIRSVSGSKANSWGYIGLLGYLADTSQSLYVRARYYLPSLARWQTVDPLWPGRHAFSYVDNLPISKVDPSGLCPWCLVPCAPCAACLVDLLVVCPAGMAGWGQCVQGVWNNLPTWTKWTCGLACVGCLACVAKLCIPIPTGEQVPIPPEGPPQGQPEPQNRSFVRNRYRNMPSALELALRLRGVTKNGSIGRYYACLHAKAIAHQSTDPQAR